MKLQLYSNVEIPYNNSKYTITTIKLRYLKTLKTNNILFK